MPLSIINIGTVGNDDTGDTLRTGGYKINENFVFLQDQINDLALVSGGGGGSGITDLESDTSPTLGGDLDLNGFTIGDATESDLVKLNELTVTSTEINYLDGTSSNVQDQIDYLTGNIGILADVTVTATEINYLDGVTSDVQTQLTDLGFAENIGVENSGDVLGAGVSNVQNFAEYVVANYLAKTEVQPLPETTTYNGADFAIIEKDGEAYKIALQVILAGSPSLRSFDSTTDTLVLTDFSGTVVSIGNTDTTITIPDNSSVAFPVNTKINIIQKGIGVVTVAADTGVVLNGALTGEVDVSDRYGKVSLIKIGANEWVASGSASTVVSDVIAPTLVSITPSDNATDVVTSVTPVFTFSEDIKFGTGTVVLRTNNSGWSNVQTWTVTNGAHVGSGAGQIEIIGNQLTIRPTTSLTNSREYAIRIATTAITDLSENAYSGITDDTTASFTTVAAVSTGPTLVSTDHTVITTGSGTQSVTLPTLAQDDYVVVIAAWDGTAAPPTAPPSGYTLVAGDNTGPGRYVAYKVMGATPDTTIPAPKSSARKQPFVWLALRGVTAVDGSATVANGTSGNPNPTALTQNHNNVFRIIWGALNDIETTLAAPAGFTLAASENSQGAGAGLGSTLGVAYQTAGGVTNDSVDPGVFTGGSNYWGAGQIGFY